MFAAGKTATVSGAGPDDKFNYVTMLLHGDGTNGGQNNTFLDSGPNTLSITRNGNTTQGSFSPYGSGWSNYFNGSSSTPLNFPDNNGFTFDADFTIEAWVFLSSTSAFQIVTSKWDVGGQEWIIAVDSGGVAEFHWAPYSDAVPAIESSSGAVTANQWTHLAAVRSGSTITLYVNGTSVGTRTNGTAGTNRTTLVTVGYLQYLGGDKLTGYVSNLRIVKGTAVYTATFTPSTTPLTAITNTQLLTCQSNRFVDNSASPFTASVNGVTVQRFNPFGTATAYSTSVIGGSGYFDGSGDNLSTPSSSGFAFGTGDFTCEAWVYSLDVSNASQRGFLQTSATAGGLSTSFSAGIIFVFGTPNGNGCINVNVGGTTYASSGGAVKANTWTHIAVTRASGAVKLFVDGVIVASGTGNTNNLTGTYACVGGYYNNDYLYQGYLSDVRIVKGTAVYTAAFTPNTAPLTAITNTSLLNNFTNGAIFDNAMMNDLETVGNAQISTSVKKYGTGSLAFDGTGDYIVSALAATPNLNLGGGSYTLEFWVNPNALTNEARMVTIEVPSSTTVGVIMGGGGSGGSNNDVQVNQFGAGTRLNASAVLSTGTWIHVAVTYNGTTSTLWIDGVSKNTYAGSVFPNSNCYVTMGGSVNYSSSTFNGYLDDVRITKGFCRYTATFTPPTSALSDTGPY